MIIVHVYSETIHWSELSFPSCWV